MPPHGWRKPADYIGYKHKSGFKRARERATDRTAGPHVLPLAYGVPIDGNPSQDQDADGDDEQDPDAAPDVGQGLISSRLRLRQAAVEQTSALFGINKDAHDVDEFMEESSQKVLSSDEDECENVSKEATTSACKRRSNTARVPDDDEDDPMEDVRVPQHGRDNNAMYVMNRDLPILYLSVTLSKTKGHVLPVWLSLIYEWMKLRCLSGAAALERGGKSQHLHVQIFLSMHIAPQDIEALKKEMKSVVGWKRGDGSGVYCQAKEFECGQTVSMMLGYIHKDLKQPHFQVRLHNIDPSDVTRGIAEWQTAKLSYEDDKISVNKGNIFHRLNAYRINANPESNNSFVKDMTDMLNTKKYMLSSIMVVQAMMMRRAAAEAMWKLVKGLEPMTPKDIESLFFYSFTPYQPGQVHPGERYYDSATPNTSIPTDMSATDGFMAANNPDLPLPPTTRATLTPFTQRLLQTRRAASTTCCTGTTTANPSTHHPTMARSSEELGSISPRSEDSIAHTSDNDFIVGDDVNEASINSDDGNTCVPVRAGNGKNVVVG